MTDLAQIAHELYTQSRQVRSAREHWPWGVLATCERLEEKLAAERPAWNLTWEWTAEAGEGPPGRYRARAQQVAGFGAVRDAYGTTEELLVEDMQAALAQAQAEDAHWAAWRAGGDPLIWHNRRILAAREQWPPGALDASERLDAGHPCWTIWWTSGNGAAERPPGFLAWHERERPKPGGGGRARPCVYGSTVAELEEAIAEVDQQIAAEENRRRTPARQE